MQIERRRPSIITWLGSQAFLCWCETNGYCRKGLSEACNRFAMQGQEPDPLTRDEFQLLVDKGCLHPKDSAAITLAVYTGLRPGELCELAVEDIDLDAGQIDINRAITANGTFKVPKTGKPRSVLLMPPAVEACRVLLSIVADHPARVIEVFQNRHESRRESVTPLLSPSTQARKKIINTWYVPTAWNTKWAAIQKRSGIRPRRPYQTRHTYACWCLTARGNLAFIAKQMGHKDFTMLVEVYARWMDGWMTNPRPNYNAYGITFNQSDKHTRGTTAPSANQTIPRSSNSALTTSRRDIILLTFLAFACNFLKIISLPPAEILAPFSIARRTPSSLLSSAL